MIKKLLLFMILLGIPCSQINGQLQVNQKETLNSKWNSFLGELADPTKPYVQCPEGEWKINKPIIINRSDVTVNFEGATIVPVDGLYMPIRVFGDLNKMEWHATGTILADTRELALDTSESMPVKVGDVHRVGIGVNYHDPNESEYVAIRKVVNVNGNTVSYDQAFGIEADIFESYDRLIQLSGYPEKVGSWGPNNVYGSQQKRGLGTDHGIRIISSPADRVILIRPKIVWPEGSRLYGSWGINLAFCRGCIILNAEVVNPCGSAVHLWWCEQCVVSGLKVSGNGGGNPWIHKVPVVVTDAAISVSAWGAVDSKISRVVQTSTNTSFINFEAGSRGVDIRNCMLSTSFDPMVRSAPQFGVYGPGSVFIKDVSVNLPTRSSSLFPGWLDDVQFSNLRILSDNIPDWLSWRNSGKHIGPMEWGNNKFGPVDTVEFSFIPDRDGYSIPYPEGIVIESTIHLQSRDNIRGITTPSECFNNTDGLVLTPVYTSYQIRIGDTYEQYRQQLSGHKIWIVRGSVVQSVTVKCKIMKQFNNDSNI